MKGQVRLLRSYTTGNRLVYDASGKLIKGGPPGTWTLDGHVQIRQLKIDQDTLEIDGDRVYMEFDTKKKEWHGLPGPGLIVQIEIPPGGLTVSEGQNLVLKVFVAESEDTDSLLPRYWYPVLEGVNPSEVLPELRALLDGDAVEAVNPKADVTAPQPIHAPEPPYIKGADLEGVVVLAALIGKDGSVRDILEIRRALGGRLDQSAISTVRTWKLKPALKNGVPVPVLITVEVTFRR